MQSGKVNAVVKTASEVFVLSGLFHGAVSPDVIGEWGLQECLHSQEWASSGELKKALGHYSCLFAHPWSSQLAYPYTRDGLRSLMSSFPFTSHKKTS